MMRLTPELGISLILLFIALLNFLYTRSVDKKRLAFEKKYYELNNLQLEKEQSAAFSIYTIPQGNSHKLVIKNIGKADARDISISIPSSDGIEILDDLSKVFPLERLSPDGTIEILSSLNYRESRKLTITINWSDDNNQNNSQDYSLTW